MNGKYAVAIDGKIVVWDNGKYSSEDKELEKALREAEIQSRENPQFRIGLDGSTLYAGPWIKPSKMWSTSFGFLQDVFGGDLEFIAGDRPTWKKLGSDTPDGAVT